MTPDINSRNRRQSRIVLEHSKTQNMTADKFLLVLGVALLVGPKPTEAFGWDWFWAFTSTTTTTAATTAASSASAGSAASNYNIMIGNRENTNTTLTDYGTMISNLQINLARFNGTALESTGATEDQLSTAIYSIAEEYRNQSETVVCQRLAWLDGAIDEARDYAAELHRYDIPGLLEAFEQGVRESTGAVNETVRHCLQREQVEVDDMIQSVVNRSRNGCLEQRLQQLVDLRQAARHNLTAFLDGGENVEDRLEHCADVQDDFDEEMSDLYKLACVSTVLLGVQTDTFKLRYTVNQLTTEAESVLSQGKALLLECATDLAAYAFDVSFGLRSWINVCTAK